MSSSRPKEDDSEEIAAVRDGATRKAIPASPRGTSSRRVVESLAARPRGAKRDDGCYGPVEDSLFDNLFEGGYVVDIVDEFLLFDGGGVILSFWRR